MNKKTSTVVEVSISCATDDELRQMIKRKQYTSYYRGRILQEAINRGLDVSKGGDE